MVSVRLFTDRSPDFRIAPFLAEQGQVPVPHHLTGPIELHCYIQESRLFEIQRGEPS